MATAPERAYDYHRDPTIALTSTRARLLLQKTPAHCKWAMDNPDTPGTDAMTFGTAVHQILLRDDRIDICYFDSWRTKDAKEARDQSVAEGRVPMLEHKWLEARQAAEHVNGQILEAGITPMPFTQGQAECVIRWHDNGADCRAMLDWLRDDSSDVNDLKTTQDASPSRFVPHVFRMGYDIQAAFYCRGVYHTRGIVPRYRWIVVETNPPYPIAVYELSQRAFQSAMVKVDAAIAIWNECIRTGQWPAYGQDIHDVDIPGWAVDAGDRWADVDLEEVPF